MKLGLYAISALLVVQLIVACSTATPKLDAKPTTMGLQKSIAALVSDKRCERREQCRSIAYGAKACGGPTSYLIYSLKHADIIKLSSEVREYNQLARESNRRNGSISNCSMLIPPTLVCREKKCVASIAR